MKTKEALTLAIETLREAAERLSLDQRAVDILGPSAPRDVRRRVQHRQRLVEALGPLQKLKSEVQEDE